MKKYNVSRSINSSVNFLSYLLSTIFRKGCVVVCLFVLFVFTTTPAYSAITSFTLILHNVNVEMKCVAVEVKGDTFSCNSSNGMSIEYPKSAVKSVKIINKGTEYVFNISEVNYDKLILAVNTLRDDNTKQINARREELRQAKYEKQRQEAQSQHTIVADVSKTDSSGDAGLFPSPSKSGGIFSEEASHANRQSMREDDRMRSRAGCSQSYASCMASCGSSGWQAGQPNCGIDCSQAQATCMMQ